ncbi:MAG: ABC transporter permease [Christensenellales bacterium]|jgi:NitT/TauT family transport system permease protein|nr:ABC transporter permease [Clostridiales bacterium]
MSDEHKKFIKKLRIRIWITRTLQITLLILFIGLWEILARKQIIDPFITSSPSRVIKIISRLYRNKNLFNHIFATLYETVMGFVLSTVLGTLIAVLLWSSAMAKDVFQPYLITLNALPKVALGPIIIVWMGAGKPAIITMALMICLIITIITMLTGFLEVDKEKLQLMKSMNANKLQTLFKLVLPANIPTLVSVLKINVGLSWVGTIMGEYLVSREGIGYLLVYGSQVFQLDLVMASTVILCALAAVMYLCVAFLEKIIKKAF